MKDFYQHLLNSFGFDNTIDFSRSMFTPSLLQVTLPLTVISTAIEQIFGFEVIVITAFIVMLILELVLGIAASRVKGQPIESKRLSRFFLKLFAWLNVLFIVNAFRFHYENNHELILTGVYDWLHSIIMIYVSFEYLISILESISTISGVSNKPLAGALRKKINQILGVK